jgi:shikimate dehydrogenase
MLAAILGSPVAHSLSPVLHNAAYDALGLTDWSYGLHECREPELAAFVDGLGPDWAGLSLTMPLKRVALDVAGGTAQSVLAALREAGIDDVTVLVRDLVRTAELRATAERLAVRPRIVATLADPARASAELVDANVVISTLPTGGADALTPPGAGAVVLDVVYAPWPTPFAAAALAAGASVRSGLEMLLHQAVAQVELMTGKPGPVAAMRTALDAAVALR